MAALDLLPEAFFWPILWDLPKSDRVDLSKSDRVKSTCNFSFKVSKTKSSVFSHSLYAILHSERQLQCGYCSCLSNILSSFSILSFILIMSLFILSTVLSFSCHSHSYSSNLLVIKPIASHKEFNWLLPLIWLPCVFLHIWRTFLFFQLFHVTIKNCYTVLWLQRFSKNICICSICNTTAQAGLSQSLWIISIIQLAAQISFLYVKKFVISIILKKFFQQQQ